MLRDATAPDWLATSGGQVLPALLAKLENDRAMDKDAEAELTAAIAAFKKSFA